MINNEDFAKRLQKVIDFYSESASSFAENIGVQRSSISHILSGRNKPSLEFILKMLHTYPEVELYWLLNGQGSFPSDNKIKDESVSTPKEIPFKQTINKTIKEDVSDKSIERIIIFYSDGSFKNYQN